MATSLRIAVRCMSEGSFGERMRLKSFSVSLQLKVRIIQKIIAQQDNSVKRYHLSSGGVEKPEEFLVTGC
jgi:hypothetical protein